MEMEMSRDWNAALFVLIVCSQTSDPRCSVMPRLYVSASNSLSNSSSKMAAARAEARKRAILARGTDRLAKLTTSARGEDGGAHLHDGESSIPGILCKLYVLIEV